MISLTNEKFESDIGYFTPILDTKYIMDSGNVVIQI